jgi:hypothetical protein
MDSLVPNGRKIVNSKNSKQIATFGYMAKGEKKPLTSAITKNP